MSADGKVPTLGEVMAEVDAVLEYKNRRYRADPALIRLIGMVAVWKREGCPEHDYPEGWPADGELATLDNCSPADSVLFGYGSEWLTLQATHLWGAGIVRGSGVIVVRRRRPEPRPYTVKASEVDPSTHAKVRLPGGEWVEIGRVEIVKYVSGGTQVDFFGVGAADSSAICARWNTPVEVIDREPQS